jgi:hypothetical protein
MPIDDNEDSVEDSDFEPLSEEELEELSADISSINNSPSSSRGRKKDDTGGYELIRAALESHLVEYAKRKHDQKRNVEQLTSIIEEYLGSFILLGYNYDGEPITLVSATTQQQSDSLSTLIQKFIMDQHPGKPPSAY